MKLICAKSFTCNEEGRAKSLLIEKVTQTDTLNLYNIFYFSFNDILKHSVASTKADVMPVSIAEWPASGII